MGLMYGVMPDCMIMAHNVERDKLKRLDTPIRPLAELIDMHERLMRPFKTSRVVAVTLNTSSLGEGPARAAIESTQRETGLPTADVVRFGCGPILDALLEHLNLK